MVYRMRCARSLFERGPARNPYCHHLRQNIFVIIFMDSRDIPCCSSQWYPRPALIERKWGGSRGAWGWELVAGDWCLGPDRAARIPLHYLRVSFYRFGLCFGWENGWNIVDRWIWVCDIFFFGKHKTTLDDTNKNGYWSKLLDDQQIYINCCSVSLETWINLNDRRIGIGNPIMVVSWLFLKKEMIIRYTTHFQLELISRNKK